MSQSFTLTAGQLIVQAYRRLGVVREGGTPNDAQYLEGMMALNALLKGWQADGINVFRQTQVSLPVTAGSPTVQITPQVMAVENARWLTSAGTVAQNERYLGVFTYDEYQVLPNKLAAVASGPASYAFDKQVSSTQLFIYPCASVAGTLLATVARMANDVNTQSDPLDLPQEWTEGCGYTLADRLMDNHGVAAADPATAQRIETRAAAFYEKLLNYDRPKSVIMKPSGSRGRRRLYRG